MRRTLLPLLLLTIACFAFSSANAQKARYEIKVKVKGLENDTLRLAYHYGNKQYIKTTAPTDDKGMAVFSGDEVLPGGIYMCAPQKGGFFEFLVTEGEQKFTIETDNTDLKGNRKAIGSEENKVFFEFEQAMDKLYGPFGKIKGEMNKEGITEEEKEKLQLQLDRMDKAKMDEKAKEYRKSIQVEYPTSFFVKLLNTSEEPETPTNPDTTNKQFVYHYLANHYFDNVDFNDPKILRSPIYYNKVKKYMEHLVLPAPDSVIKYMGMLMEKTTHDTDFFKFTLITTFNYWMNKKLMCFDTVYIWYGEQYYLSGMTPWADTAFTNKMQKNIHDMKPCLCGKKGHDLMVNDTSKAWKPLYEQKEEYLILLFWSPTCGHCKKEIPKIKEWYHKVKKEEDWDFEIFGVVTNQDEEPWKKFVKDNELPWINTMDIYGRSNFRHWYNIYSTPVIYILDKDRKIIAKRIDEKALDEILRREYEMKEKRKEKKEKDKELKKE